EEQPSRERLKRLLRDIGTDEGDGPAALEAVSCWDDDWLSACGLYTVWTMKQEPLYRLFMQESPARQPDRYPIAAETAAVLRQRISNREAG
ncbi:MAG TPA: hypothetical protein VLB27_00370, partial [candidate division Zixibacteria bacterium]|nr:hypothetical protein [candidate division Zixibacteria bacterium]